MSIAYTVNCPTEVNFSAKVEKRKERKEGMSQKTRTEEPEAKGTKSDYYYENWCGERKKRKEKQCLQ